MAHPRSHGEIRAVSHDALDLASPEASARVPFTTTDARLTTFDHGVAACREMLAGTGDDAMRAAWTLKHGERALFSLPDIHGPTADTLPS